MAKPMEVMDNGDMSPHIRAILFDLEGTLLDAEASRRAFLVVQWQGFLDDLLHVPAGVYVEAVQRAFREGEGSGQQAYRRAMRELKLPEGLGDQLEVDRQEHGDGTPRLFPETLNVVRDLSRHASLGLVSNGREGEQMRILAKTGLLPYFQVLMFSETCGRAKPATDLFARALHELRVPAGEAVMVGDSEEEDIQPALFLGMHAVWKRGAGLPFSSQARMVETIDDLRDLPHALRDLVAAPAG